MLFHKISHGMDGKMQTERNICLLGYYPHRQCILLIRCARWFSFVCTHTLTRARASARTTTTYFVFYISIIITYQYTDVQYFLSFIADSTCNFNRFSFLVSSVFRFQSVYVQLFAFFLFGLIFGICSIIIFQVA